MTGTILAVPEPWITNNAFLCAAAQAFPPNGRRPAASVGIMVAPGRS
ncbi:hypothetical protein [Streptomyces sp. NBC_01443]|nr:hypothetical protein [Streptomyces sp. NBC_01443]MCX4632017.1 hypothetical protein [Streptomyces sp. NBC_01443]